MNNIPDILRILSGRGIMAVNMKKKIDEWLRKDYRLTFMERVRLLIESEQKFKNDPPAICYGKTLEYILNNISVVVDSESMIAGKVKEEIPSEDEKARIDEIYKSWWDRPLEEVQKDALFYYSNGWRKCRAPWFYSLGHLAFDWELLVEKGLNGFFDKVDSVKQDSLPETKQSFLKGISICLSSISHYIERYADAYEQIPDGSEKAASLRYLSKGKPRTFEEALQLIWFITLITQKVCGCGVLNYSRMDQYLLPLFRADMEKGTITNGEAEALLQQFFFKMNEIMAPTDHMSQEIETTKYTLEVTYDDPNYLILGGLLPDGTGGENELSALMIEMARTLKLRNPFIVVRYYKGISDAFMNLVCEAMKENTTIIIYNDEDMIPALKKYGIQEPEVYNYGFFGCNDPNVPADMGGLRQVWFNFGKAIELALNNGDYPMEPRGNKPMGKCQFSLEDRLIGLMIGPYYGIETGKPEDLRSMDDVIDAFKKQLEFLVMEYRRGLEEDMIIEKAVDGGRMRIEDCFIRGTIENATTWTSGGTKYHVVLAQGAGLATAVNSLYAIEKVVFNEKMLSLEELSTILSQNYKGREDIQNYLRKKVEKFGNDIEEVDRYAAIVVDAFIEAVEKANDGDYLYTFLPTLHTDRDFTVMGQYVGATPDGRSAKEQISENQSPEEGTDVNGLTAMLNSLSKTPFNKITGGPLNIRIHPSLVKGEQGTKNLQAVLKTYFDNGGLQVQINVVDAETLKEAKKNPDKYRDLCVRVTGYSAFFTQMGEQAQDELIRRTEQGVA